MDFELKWSGATVKENCISEEVGYLILMKKWFTFIYSDKAISCWNIIFLKRWHKIFTIIQLIKSLNRFNLYSKIIISKNLINVISRISNKTKQIILPILIIINQWHSQLNIIQFINILMKISSEIISYRQFSWFSADW